MIDPKNRSLVCRMAGNIVSGLLSANFTQSELNERITTEFMECLVSDSVNIAIAIVENVDKRIAGETK